jgi:hypothetical protein
VIKTGNTEPFHEATVTNARLFGYIVKPDAKDFKDLAYAFVEGMAVADKLIKKRDSGEVVDVEAAAPPEHVNGCEAHLFKNLTSKWV